MRHGRVHQILRRRVAPTDAILVEVDHLGSCCRSPAVPPREVRQQSCARVVGVVGGRVDPKRPFEVVGHEIRRRQAEAVGRVAIQRRGGGGRDGDDGAIARRRVITVVLPALGGGRLGAREQSDDLAAYALPRDAHVVQRACAAVVARTDDGRVEAVLLDALGRLRAGVAVVAVGDGGAWAPCPAQHGLLRQPVLSPRLLRRAAGRQHQHAHHRFVSHHPTLFAWRSGGAMDAALSLALKSAGRRGSVRHDASLRLVQSRRPRLQRAPGPG